MRREKAVGVREAVQQRGHRPGEPLRAPDPVQHAGGVVVDPGAGPGTVVVGERIEQAAHVVDREVQPLGPGRRHDMRRVPGQEQPAEAQRLHHEGAERRDRLLDRGAGLQRAAVDSAVAGPARRRSGRPASRPRPRPCGIAGSSGCAWPSAWSTARSRARDGRRPARARPAAGRPARPASRTDTRVRTPACAAAGTLARRDAVVAVAPGDEVAGQLAAHPVRVKPTRGRSPVVVQRRVLRLVQRGGARGGAQRHQVARDLGLAVDHDGPPGEADRSMRSASPSKLSMKPVCGSPSARMRAPAPARSSRSTVPCSSTPARMRPST